MGVEVKIKLFKTPPYLFHNIVTFLLYHNFKNVY